MAATLPKQKHMHTPLCACNTTPVHNVLLYPLLLIPGTLYPTCYHVNAICVIIHDGQAVTVTPGQLQYMEYVLLVTYMDVE